MPQRRKDSKLTWERRTMWVQAWCEEDGCKWHIQAFCGDNARNNLIRHLRNIHGRGPPVVKKRGPFKKRQVEVQESTKISGGTKRKRRRQETDSNIDSETDSTESSSNEGIGQPKRGKYTIESTEEEEPERVVMLKQQSQFHLICRHHCRPNQAVHT